MPRIRVDVSKLYATLDAARRGRDLSWRQLAGAVGVSPSTMTRLANGHRPDVDAFVALVRWLGMPAEDFMVGDEADEQEKPEVLAEVTALLRARPELDNDEVKHLQEVLEVAMRRFADERAARAR